MRPARGLVEAGSFVRRRRDGMVGRAGRVHAMAHSRGIAYDQDIVWIGEWTYSAWTPGRRGAAAMDVLDGPEAEEARARFARLECPACGGTGAKDRRLPRGALPARPAHRRRAGLRRELRRIHAAPRSPPGGRRRPRRGRAGVGDGVRRGEGLARRATQVRRDLRRVRRAPGGRDSGADAQGRRPLARALRGARLLSRPAPAPPDVDDAWHRGPAYTTGPTASGAKRPRGLGPAQPA